MRGIKASSQSTHVRTFTENNDEIGSNVCEAAAFNGNTKERTKLHEYKTIFNEILSQNSTQPVEYYKVIDWNQVEA